MFWLLGDRRAMGMYDVLFLWVFIGFGDDNTFTKLPNMGYLALVEADVVYVCRVCYCFLA